MSAVVAEQEFRHFATALHHYRLRRAELQAALNALQLKFEVENAVLLSSLSDLTGSEHELEMTLRALTLAAYHETGDKKPWPGVGIRVNRALYYEQEAALTWAKEHGLALALDAKAFRAIAQVQSLDFVRIEEEAQATIAQDLGAHIGPEDRDAFAPATQTGS